MAPLEFLATDIERLIGRLADHGVPLEGQIRVRAAIERELASAPLPSPSRERDQPVTEPGIPSAKRKKSSMRIPAVTSEMAEEARLKRLIDEHDGIFCPPDCELCKAKDNNR